MLFARPLGMERPAKWMGLAGPFVSGLRPEEHVIDYTREIDNYRGSPVGVAGR
jgi:hypothetical protein